MNTQLDFEINKELGECYLLMGDYNKAEEYYLKASDAESCSSEPYMGLATIAVQRGKMDDALVLYKKAMSVSENDKTLCGVGLVLMETGKHAESFGYFERALKINPENMVAMNCLVREGYELNCVEKVVPYLRACLDLDCNKEAVRVTLAGCLISLGEKDGARAELEAVLQINPSNTGAIEIFETIAA